MKTATFLEAIEAAMYGPMADDRRWWRDHGVSKRWMLWEAGSLRDENDFGFIPSMEDRDATWFNDGTQP